MNKQKIIEELEVFKVRLTGEVIEAFESKGRDFGRNRFSSWRKKLAQFFDGNMPGESSVLNGKLQSYFILSKRYTESDGEYFWRSDGETMLSYIESLIIDVKNDEYDIRSIEEKEVKPSIESKVISKGKSNKVFIVHGHDNEAKEKTARFIEKLGFEAIVLHEQASKSKTIIEKIESYSDETDFAIVIYTPDDAGNVRSEAEGGELQNRARQNVVFEHGFLIGKLGRENVVPLVSGNVELPNDISGIVYISDRDWQVDIAREMSAVGYDIDFNKLYK